MPVAALRLEGLTELERAVTVQVHAYLVADRPNPEAATVLGGLLPELRGAATRTRGVRTMSRLEARADQLRMMAELVHGDRAPA
ncbi:hypothetical protein AB0D54_26440 [Streptomyces xanthophaeus]|uniref:hypothetical protein n=1 Tax=Streptomyces xanthophaeus TaxID=67385 RepID=UPI00343FE39B